ncbi:MAG: hydrogenase [Candidatus Omnitrophota bacterium]|jgi:Ni,Fe-hydrogenase III large subunit
MGDNSLKTRICQPIDVNSIDCLAFKEFKDSVLDGFLKGFRAAAFFGLPADNGQVRLIMILACDRQGYLRILSTMVKDSYPCLTTQAPQVHLFEREIFEQLGVYPKGHPWLKPVRSHVPYQPQTVTAGGRDSLLGVDFFKVQGMETHEVGVGPVHAGIIEPGHFRFQCHGEQVLHLEVLLGYQHRGIESMLFTKDASPAIHYMETAAGDTSIGHCLAYCQAIEALSACEVPLRAQVIRAVMLELERLANHTGDLGAMAADIGYLPASSYCGRLRGDLLNMTALVCGNRFGRNIIRPGGSAFDIDEPIRTEIRKRLKSVFSDVSNAVSLMWSSPMVVDRFDETGFVSQQTAVELGLVGVSARACGIERDARFDFPAGAFRFFHIPPSNYSSGDVFARAFVRWLEIQRSVEFILERLRCLPKGPIMSDMPPIKNGKAVVSLVEGWRGEICHFALSGEKGGIVNYKITDPSFHNWTGLAVACRGEEISNFPLCNKSFNLSYCGHDL